MCLYMFRAQLCLSSGVKNYITQHLASSAACRVWWCQMLCDTILTSWWWAQLYSKHVKAYNKSYYKTRFCALSWLITKISFVVVQNTAGVATGVMPEYGRTHPTSTDFPHTKGNLRTVFDVNVHVNLQLCTLKGGWLSSQVILWSEVMYSFFFSWLL